VPPGDPKTWVVLGIESSCDDTAAAVIRGDGTVLAHRIASQVGVSQGKKETVCSSEQDQRVHEGCKQNI
jgi:tRNA A37 threonylcarbamoyltransferase TsaD